MESFNLDTKLLQFGTGDDLCKNWCIRQSVLGCQAFGSNGSGKSSSLKTLALASLRAGYGFLVLSAKSERATWEEYCKLAGRSDDLIIIGEDSPHRFDFMKYLSQGGKGTALTANLLNILKAVIRVDEEQAKGQSDPFWQKSLDLLLYNTISLCQLANNGTVGVQEMYDIIQSAPQGSNDDDSGNATDNPDSAFSLAFESIRQELTDDYQTWQNGWTDEQKLRFEDKKALEKAVLETFPKARSFKFVEQFFFETFKTLSQKTKSIILLSLSSFLFSLLQDPMYTLFCNGEITVKPEDSFLNAKVILLDLPVRHYHEAGRSAQLLFKYIWQLQCEKRDIQENDRPVCLWSDESPVFLMQHDAAFQATARDCRVAVVYIAQNMHQYYAAMGGAKSADLVASFLATLNTKFWFSNSCTTTNKASSELCGDTTFFDPSRTITTAKEFSQTDSVGLKIDREVRPEAFTSLKTGGPTNNCIVEAYIHVQGDKLFNGKNFKKIKFNQNYK